MVSGLPGDAPPREQREHYALEPRLNWLLGSLAYLGLHALLYVTVLRSRNTFRRERGIFAFHALSAVAVTFVALIAAVLAPSGESLAVLVGVVALHGIYSMSFLELWSLSQGSYSLTILRSIDELEEGAPLDAPALEAVGTGKRQQRLQGLISLRLAERRGDTMALTSAGMLAGGGLGLITWLANVRQDR